MQSINREQMQSHEKELLFNGTVWALCAASLKSDVTQEVVKQITM